MSVHGYQSLVAGLCHRKLICRLRAHTDVACLPRRADCTVPASAQWRTAGEAQGSIARSTPRMGTNPAILISRSLGSSMK